MTQPPFWLKISNRYVIENFEQLLKYVKAYNYVYEDESEDSDFVQTYRHLKSVADEYSCMIKNFKIYETPQFDIPFNKVARIIATAILTARKMGIDDFDLLTSLINLLVLNNKTLNPEIERKYFNIICLCIKRYPVDRLKLSLSDLDEDKFMLGLLETKLADTTFKTPAATPTDHIYENRGCLTVGSDSLTLSNVSYADSKKKKSKGELHTDLGLDVLTSSPCNADSLDELLDIYPHISNEFDSMKPVPRPTLKRYSATETIIMRVTQVSGLKVVVETADPDYEYESGNVFIDANISLIPKDSLLKELRVGDYLPVVRNDHANLPFRLSRECVTDFVDEYARQCSDEEECDELLSVYDTDFNGGSRWLSESGLYINIFDNDVAQSGIEEEYNYAVSNRLPSLLTIHSWSIDAGNCRVKGKFAGFTNDEDSPLDETTFKANAYHYFIDNFISYVYDRRPQIKETIHTEPIDPDTIHLLGILTYRLALKITRGDSLSRIRHLIAAMLLVKMAGNNDDADFVRTQLDYQKAVILFAKGTSPTALPRVSSTSESIAEETRAEKEIVDILHGYKEITDGGDATLRPTLLYGSRLADTRPVVQDLVKASNSLLNRIDISEINRIKKNICAHLNVADQYKDIYNERTNYGVESDFLEFKASCARPPIQSSSLLNDINIQKWTILKAICAFLNSISGGDLLIGVSDNGFALGLDEDIQFLYREHMISEPNADRLRTYLKLFIDKGFTTADGRVSGTAITAERVKFIIEKNEENREILRVKVTPYPWDVVRISAPDRPNGFHDTYIRTSGASTPLNHAGVREVKLRKLNSLDKNLLKIAKIRQAIDENVIVEIKNYNSVNGLSDRRIEPYKVYDDNKSFLAYDIDRHDMRRFKVSRFKDSDLNVTKDKWKNQKKHADRSVDIFGMVESATSPGETVRVKLTDYARCLLLEECNISLHDDNSPVNSILHRNPDYTDSKRFPWLLEVKVYGFDGVARFVMGLPAHTKITDTPRLDDHIRRLTTPV